MAFNITGTGTNQNPLESTLMDVVHGTGLVRNSNVIYSTDTPGISVYKESVENYSDSQWAEVAYSGLSGGDEPGCVVRGRNSGSGFNGYTARTSTGDERIYIQKWTNGVPNTEAAPVVPDLISPLRMEIETIAGEDVISIFQNGVEIEFSPFTIDGAALTGGQPGGYYENGNLHVTSITNISGGDLGDAPPAENPGIRTNALRDKNGTLLANQTDIEWEIFDGWAPGSTSIAHGSTGTTDASGIFFYDNDLIEVDSEYKLDLFKGDEASNWNAQAKLLGIDLDA